MKDKVANITRWILYVLLTLAAVPGILYYVGGISTDAFLDWGKLFVILGVAVIIIAPIYTMIVNPKNLIKMLLSVVLLVVVLVVSYGLATNQFSALQLEKYNVTAETSRLVGMGLYATYISFGLAVLAILYSGVVKLFK